MSDKIKVTGFLSVFEDKLERLIKQIKKEYTKPKDERNRAALKRLAREAKDMKKLVKQCKDADGKTILCCPHCEKEIEI